LLEGWRRYDDGWMAYVRDHRAVGMRYLEWVDADEYGMTRTPSRTALPESEGLAVSAVAT
jgi:hypothetical protein